MGIVNILRQASRNLNFRYWSVRRTEEQVLFGGVADTASSTGNAHAPGEGVVQGTGALIVPVSFGQVERYAAGPGIEDIGLVVAETGHG